MEIGVVVAKQTQLPGVGLAGRGVSAIMILYFDKCKNMESNQAVKMLAALAQESRLAIFRLLVEAGPAGRSAGQVGEALAIAPATLSFHFKELAHAGLIEGRQDGRYVIYSARFAEMSALLAYLSEHCCRETAADGCC